MSSCEADLESILQRIAADLPPGRWLPALFLDPSFADPARADGTPDVSDAVVRIGGSTRPLGLEHGRESACRTAMSVVQDEVIDMTGRPWPEVLDGRGASIGVLDVVLPDGGVAAWTLGGDEVGPVGRLVAACEDRGWRIRV